MSLTYVLPMDTMLRSAWPRPAAKPRIQGAALPPPPPSTIVGPYCTISSKPPKRLTIPAEPTPASGIAELREWLAKNEHWLELSRWSRGIPALETPVRPRRVDTPVEAMTVQQLADTQDSELPSVSRTAYDELGVEVLSLEWTDDPEQGTLADAVGEDARQYLALEFIDGREATLDEAVQAEIEDVRQSMARRYGTPYDFPHPDVRDRIDWERYTAKCSGVTRHEGFRVGENAVTFFSFPRLSGKEFAQRRDAYVADFLARIGRAVMPTPSEFRKKRSVLRALAQQYRWREEADHEDQLFDQLERERSWLIARDGGTSWDEVESDYVPAYATLVEAAWRSIKPKAWVDRQQYAALRARARAEGLTAWQAARKAASQQTVHHCRNSRSHGSTDEMWHATSRPADETAIGWLDDEFPYSSRQMREYKPGPAPRKLIRTPVTVAQMMAIEGGAKRAIERFAVHAFQLGKKSYVFHS